MHNRNTIKNTKPPALQQAVSYKRLRNAVEWCVLAKRGNDTVVQSAVLVAVCRNAAKEKKSSYDLHGNGQVMATYTVTNTATIKQAQVDEHVIYGNGRIGLVQEDAQTFVFINQVTLPNEGPYWTQKTGKKNYELTNYLGNVNTVITDRKVLDPTNPVFKAVVVATTDYYAFGMAMPGRQTGSGAYRFGYTGKEIDPELKGNGNSYDFGARQYDPRLGRWLSLDPMKSMYPSMSPYCYAGNTPIAAKDPDGNFIIFVNGYIYGPPGLATFGGGPEGAIIPFKRDYWYENIDNMPINSDGSYDNSPYIKAAQKHFNDNEVKYVNGTGWDAGSTASDRKKAGKEYAESQIANILSDLAYLGPDEKIEIVTHSMGTAFSEGMIEVFMNYPDIASRITTVVHFSAADADAIEIDPRSYYIDRFQVNIKGDIVIGKWADPFSDCGYKIEGVNENNYLEIRDNSIEKWHPNYYNTMILKGKTPVWDFHFDTKVNPIVFEYLKIIDKNNYNQKQEKTLPNNWDHRDGSTGQQLPNNVG